jgi:alpha-tubulin suppressor-like RCC1 family protein
MKRLTTLLVTAIILPATLSIALAAAPAPVAKTGQTTSYVAGDDGDLEPGAAWPTPRFADNNNQTMTDTLTGLIWSKNANAPGPAACGPGTTKTWQGALDYVKCLNTNAWLGYNDWSLPNRKELSSLVNLGQSSHAVWLNTQGFTSVQANYYWSGSTFLRSPDLAWVVDVNKGYVYDNYKTFSNYVWPVRSGQFGSLTLSPATSTFVATESGTQSAPVTLTLANSGKTSVSVTTITITGTNNTQFNVSPGGATPCASLTPTLASGTSCTLNVVFAPTSIGTKTATLQVTSINVLTPTLQSTLSGIGTDIVIPIISTFTLTTTTSKSLAIPIKSFTATDNVAVTGFKITETATTPLPDDTGWTATAPTTYTFTTSGNKTLYAWAKDAAGNVSAAATATVLVDTTKPTVSAFTLPARYNSLTVPVTSFTASDDLGVGAYLITTTATAPLATDINWSATAQATFTFAPATTNGTYTLYAWAKDNAGNISATASGASVSFGLCSITASSDTNGTITLPGESNYYCNQNRLYKMAPKPGYKIADVLVDGLSVGKVSSYLFTSTAATDSHTISATFEPDPFANWHQVTPGYLHTLAVRADGTMWAWGDNSGKQLGDGTSTPRYNPIRVTAYSDWQAVAAGPYHSLGRRVNGNLYGWGDNSSGQLGASGSALPVLIDSNIYWQDLAAAGTAGATPALSSSYSLTRKTDGSFKQMGVSPTSSATAALLTDWVVLSAGISHAAAIRADGTIWSWGANTKGQLGDSSIATRTTPVQTGSATNWVQVAAGAAHSVGLQANGTLWTWGDNSKGQLGTDQMPNYSSSPFQIGSDQSWKAVSAGDNHTLALRSDGTIWAFGDNSSGQLGDGSGATTNFPVQVGTDSDWNSITAHGNISYGIKNNNTLYAWGANNKGQLGDTTTVNKLSPVLVGTNTNSFVIAATSSNGGSISPSGALTAAAGTDKTFSIAPLVGWHINDVVVDGVSKGTISSHTFTSIIDRHTIFATFSPDATVSHTITASAGIGASISPNGTVVVADGTSQLLTISPQTGYQISDVKIDGVSQGVLTTYTFSNMTANHTIQVTASLIDSTVPTGSISINSGAMATTNNVTTLTLSATDTGGNLYQMRLSLDNVSWSAWEAYATSRSYTLPAGDGTKNLYVQYRDTVGNISIAYRGTIILDTLAPTGSVSLNNGDASTSQTAVTASLNSSDGGSGVTQMQLSWDNITWQAWEVYAVTKSVIASGGVGTKTLYVRFRDLAGNVSTVANDSIILTASSDVVAPVVSEFILTATSDSLTVPVSTFTASDNTGVTGYLISESAIQPQGNDQGWSAILPTEFVFTSQGVKTLYAFAKDAAGNISVPLSANVTITMADIIAPVVSSFTLPATAVSLTVPVTALAATDAVGVTGYLISEVAAQPLSNDQGWSATLPTQYVFTSQGAKTLNAFAKDAAENISAPLSATITITLADTTAPVVTNFTISANSTSLTVPVTALVATDAVGVTGYQISESATQPLSSDLGWSVTLPTQYVFTSQGSKTLYAFAKDAAGNISAPRSANVTITMADTTAPVVSSFTIPATSTSLTVPVSSFSATDAVGVNGYYLSETPTAPLLSDSHWATMPTSSFTFASAGSKTLYAFAKDAAGNISAPVSDTVTITLADMAAPTVTVFTMPTTATSLTVPVTIFSANDNIAVTGYILTESVTAPLASVSGWTSTVPSAYTFSAAGSKTLYAFAKDAAGNVSVPVTASITITLPDTTAPTITTFVIPATSSSLTVPVITFIATDNVAVTGYLLSEGSTAPSLTTQSWTSTSQGSYTFSTVGSKTLYAFAKDAAGNISPPASDSVVITLPAIAGVCGSSNGQAQGTAPTINFCSVGTASVVTGTGPWGWTCSGTNGGTTATCAASIATSTPTQFTVTPTAGSGFTLTPATPQTVNNNGTTSFNVAPASGYGIASVSGCGGSFSGSIYTTGPITANCTISVTAVARTATSGSGSSSLPTITDALKVLQSVVGITPLTATERIRYDVAPLSTSGIPLGNGVLDAADVIAILRRSIGIGSW